MKKSLLLLSAAVLASAANAQVIVGLATDEEIAAAGIEKDKKAMDPVTILDNEAGTFGLAFADSWGYGDCYKNGIKNITINGEAFTLNHGAVGNTNPSFVSYEDGAQTAGAVFKIEAKKDGYMTVFTSINPNKQYVIYEGTKDGAIVFSLGWAKGDQKIFYTMPNDGDGYIDMAVAAEKGYVIAATVQKTNEAGVKLWENKVTHEIVAAESNPTVKDDPDQQYQGVMEVVEGASKPAMPWNVAGFESAPGESTGFVSFPVFEGSEYYFSALGSKCCCGGFVYSEEAPTVVYEEIVNAETGEVTQPRVEFPAQLGGEGESVETVAVAAQDAPIYNAQGIRVNADAKGLLIQNGKKFIRK